MVTTLRSTINLIRALVSGHPMWNTRARLLILSVLILSARAQAAGPKVVVFVAGATSLQDLPSGRVVGLMNSRTAGRIMLGTEAFTDGKYAPEAGYMTIGAGSRTTAGTDADEAYNADEPVQGTDAKTVFQRMTLTDPGRAEVVHPRIARLTNDNSTLSYDVTLGAIGTALHKAGLKTAVIGNADDGRIHREAVTIAMDRNGLVDYGNVGPEMVIRDPRALSGFRTNEKRLLAEFERCLPLADFIVVEFGDTARLDRARPDMMDEAYTRQRAIVRTQTESLLHEIQSRIDSRTTRLIAICPFPSSYELENHENSLCPVVIYERGEQPSGVLTSGSTRVRGVITNTDIAPSVLTWLGVAATGFVGRTIQESKNEGAYPHLENIIAQTARQSATLPVLRQVMVVTIILVVVATLLWLAVPAGSGLRRRLIALVTLVPPALAPAMMLIALHPVDSRLVTWAALIAVTAAIVGFCALVGRRATDTLMLISLGSVVLFAADIALGGHLCRSSIMGYSIAEGARYYGIGNEFMGSMIGACIVGIGLLAGKLHAGRGLMQAILVFGLLIGTAAIGAPMLGANMGGAISVIIAFGCALVATAKNPLDPRKALGVMFGVVLFLAVFAFLDSMRGQQYQSHLGKALQGIREGGLGEAGMIIKRKLAMNWMLITFSVWSRVLAAFLISLTAVLIPHGTCRQLRPLPVYLRVTFAGAVAGTIAALAFNDSGVVAAATCFAFPWSLALLIALDAESSAARK